MPGQGAIASDMFTGIIEALGTIISIKKDGGGQYVSFKRPKDFDDLKIGSSVACNGICLTVLELDSHQFTVQVMQETLKKSNAGLWKAGDLINLERALKIGGRLDGHWVMGHIDRAVRFLRKEMQKDTGYYYFELYPQDRQLLIPQGSIAINGVSLTLAGLSSKEFYVALIKHTESFSNISLLKGGALANLEYDALGKYLLRRDL